MNFNVIFIVPVDNFYLWEIIINISDDCVNIYVHIGPMRYDNKIEVIFHIQL